MTPKQTAVEWLQVQLNENGKLSVVDFYQAKEMEKQQIIEFADKYDAYCTWVVQGRTLTAEQYYKETFNTKKP